MTGASGNAPKILSPMQETLNLAQDVRDTCIKIEEDISSAVNEVIGDKSSEQDDMAEPACPFEGALSGIFDCLKQIRRSIRRMNQGVKRL